MKRIFALVLSFVFLLSCLVLPAGAMFDPSPVYQVQAASAYIVNTDTNIIVYDKDSTKQVSAGGLTKYMTLAVLLTNYADQLDSTFQMPFAISDYVYNTNNADMRSNETSPTGKPCTPCLPAMPTRQPWVWRTPLPAAIWTAGWRR